MYYLPIKINDRRIHICRLENNGGAHNNIFGFIIPKAKHGQQMQLFSIAPSSAALISDCGYSKDVRLNSLTPIINLEQENRLLTITFAEKKDNYTENGNENCPFLRKRATGITILIDTTLMTQIAWDNVDFTVKLCYKDYAYSFKVYYCDGSKLKEAAIDFGSEASQVRMNGNSVNMNLLEEFQEITNKPENEDYWEGKSGDPFFKSIFFVHTQPTRPIHAEDVPNLYSDKTFVQALVQKTANLENLLILPNLKLLDILSGNVMSQTIDFSGDAEDDIRRMGIPKKGNLGNSTVRKLVLGNVLNNFLHCILQAQEVNGSAFFYLRLTILMPNVYPQSKVYQVVEGLYRGFEMIKEKYPYCKGLEVQVLSESDASFLGVRNTQVWTIDGRSVTLKNKANGYFFIIDAGKGTTDFSIMKQQADHNSTFDSVIRGGIPISGHYITYAFYEAVRDWFNNNGVNLNQLLRDSVKSNRKPLCEFMDILDEFKKNYNSASGEMGKPQGNITGSWTLDYVNTILQTLVTKKLPNIENKVTQAVSDIVRGVECAIKPYCKTHGVVFTQAMLTGRGFMFTPLRDAMEAMLHANGWLEKNEKCLWRGGDQAKSVCMEGAFSMGSAASVNENTDLVGFPTIEKKSTNAFFAKLHNYFNNNNVDADFFYHGIRVNEPNPEFRIGMYKYITTSNSNEERRLYFVGDDFILQGRNELSELTCSNYTADSDGLIQSLFPFYEGSIPTEDPVPATPSTTADDSNPQTDDSQFPTPLPTPGNSYEMPDTHENISGNGIF